MDLIQLVDEEIDRLNAVKALLTGETLLRGLPKERLKRTISPKGRKAIAAAQRLRWAEKKRLQRAKE